MRACVCVCVMVVVIYSKYYQHSGRRRMKEEGMEGEENKRRNQRRGEGVVMEDGRE